MRKNVNDRLLLAGFILLTLFGSALDSQGWAGWVAVAGTAIGIATIWAGGEYERRRYPLHLREWVSRV